MTTAAATASLVFDGKHQLGEGVLWCQRTQRLLWTDILGAALWCLTPATGVTQSWPMPERLATFALTEDDDRLLLGLASQLAWFRFSEQSVTPICTVEAELPHTRVNDGRCDRFGRFVFGTKNDAADMAACASFYRLNADLTLERLALPPVAISNSICFSPDGHTMYYCDSLAKKIHCCDYDTAAGTISRERLFADLSAQPGEPDGSAIDSQGYLWNAQWGGHRVLRLAPDGSIERLLEVPVAQPSCVAFGGAGLHDLYISSARESLSPEALLAEPAAGGLFRHHVADVCGLPEARFDGA
ncbi:SMP-30/gluconolactonase/LRE family protein [Collimonas sp.]|jgi:L-arabinonolactonase|uniref:SMP-30/gluconolactonase/LRE family protein n=1 Tax=Collimonas sp. TaxID=1963772 RepID=UPI002B755173|nr:SMP-30/gluconolactonase/LRE family protein [Collimonas sp.]HWW99651.1 SMP-30/gluconolactonase/LRE family protein [Collimonas sp.]